MQKETVIIIGGGPCGLAVRNFVAKGRDKSVSN